MKAKRFRLVLFILFLCLIPAFTIGCGDDDDDDDDDDGVPNPWELEIVDQEGNVGSINSMGVEANGTAHISYFDADNQRIKYAAGESGDWSIETLQLEDEFLATGPNAIGVDGSGVASVIYTSESTLDDSGTLWLVNNSGGAWSRISIANEMTEYLDIHVQDDGVAHIAFTGTGSNELWHMTNVTGNWAQSQVDSGSIGEVAVTSNELGRGQVIYYHADSGSLRYAEFTASGWDDPVTIASGSIRYPDAIYKNGITYVCFYDESAGYLKLANNEGGEWDVSILDDTGDVGIHSSMTFGPLDTVHISYYGAPALRYATNWGDVWNTTQVDAKVGNGKSDTSIGLDSEGYVYITYFDITDLLLKFAKSKEPVDNLVIQ
jgi:hypothetical protein